MHWMRPTAHLEAVTIRASKPALRTSPPSVLLEANALCSDGIYPDPNSGGYKSQDCGRYAAPAVISTSYGSNEADLSAAYEKRQCNE